MFQSNKIHDNVLHLNFASNYTSDVENNNDIENTNYSFQFFSNSTQDLKVEHSLANNNNYVSESFSISEWNLYGSSRLGTRNLDKPTDVIFLASRNYNWINSTVTNEYIAPSQSFTYKKYRVLGVKTFELTNHLGNVITTISDRKLMVQNQQTPGFLHHYKPEILSIGEQYAFGMSMPGRTFSVEKYRYGMNSQEKDDDIFEGAFTAEYWEYDSRLGRRWNNDPLVYEWQSPYACFNNNPICFADPTGLEGEKPDNGEGSHDFAGQAPGSENGGIKPESYYERGSRTSEENSGQAKEGSQQDASKSSKRSPDFSLRYGNTPGNVENPPFLKQIYGSQKVEYYNTPYQGPEKFSPDEPNGFLQLQTRLKGNIELASLIMKQKFRPNSNGFKLEAPTAVEFGLAYKKEIFNNNWFNLSLDFSGTAGITVADAKFPQGSGITVYKNFSIAGYAPVGFGATMLTRVDATFINGITIFVAGNVHHYQGTKVCTSIGGQRVNYLGSAEITIGAGYIIGK
jgi:hypothetical protein